MPKMTPPLPRSQARGCSPTATRARRAPPTARRGAPARHAWHPARAWAAPPGVAPPACPGPSPTPCPLSCRGCRPKRRGAVAPSAGPGRRSKRRHARGVPRLRASAAPTTGALPTSTRPAAQPSSARWRGPRRPASSPPHALLGHARVAHRRGTLHAMAACATASAPRAQAPPACPWCDALPGARAVFAPRLLGAVGAPRARDASAEARQPAAGMAPVTARRSTQVWGHGRLQGPTCLAPPGWRVGRGIDPACLLGAGLRPAATRPGQGAPGRRARLGLPLDAPPCSGWAGAPARRCLRVSSSAHTPQCPTPAPRGTWSLQRSQNTLTAPRRACVRPRCAPAPQPARSPLAPDATSCGMPRLTRTAPTLWETHTRYRRTGHRATLPPAHYVRRHAMPTLTRARAPAPAAARRSWGLLPSPTDCNARSPGWGGGMGRRVPQPAARVWSWG